MTVSFNRSLLHSIVTARRGPLADNSLMRSDEEKLMNVGDQALLERGGRWSLPALWEAPATLYRALGAQYFRADDEGAEGVRFAVYAPAASKVSVIGDFNSWLPDADLCQRREDGYWSCFVAEARLGHGYKFAIWDGSGRRLTDKSDPFGLAHDQHPSFASRVEDPSAYQWADEEWMSARQRRQPLGDPISIYELHVGSWRRDQSGHPLSYRALAAELIPYVKELGFSHIELLPVMEHPFTGSWGYQPLGLFAPTTRYGRPDDFKFFIDQCHQAGIGVILDWVPAHFPADEHGLARFDGTPLYEYADPREGWHPDWATHIYDYGKDAVRRFLVASALSWFDRYHIDGIRVDAVASMLYRDYSRSAGEWIPNCDGGNQNYEAISLLKWMNEEIYRAYPGAMSIAEESTAFSGVSRPTYLGGLGFGFKWNMGWMNDSLTYLERDPIHRAHHHNEITFSMVYHYDENFILALSHDEVVHGKNALLEKMPGDEWQKAATLRAYLTFMFAHPGKKLNFMGNEFAQGTEWSHEESLPWWLLDFPKHRGHQLLFKDLNQLYRTLPALHELDHDQRGFEWIEHDDHQQSVLSWIRYADSGAPPVVAVINFTPTPHAVYRVGVPALGRYRLRLNSDAGCYWGSGLPTLECFEAEEIGAHGRPYSLALCLPPLAGLILEREPGGEEI